MEKLVKQLELGVLGPIPSRPSSSTYPHSNFLFMFNASVFKISSGPLTVSNWTIQLTRSNYQNLQPHTNPLDPHSWLFSSHPRDASVLQEAVTEDWPSALIPNQKGWMIGSTTQGRNGSLCWSRKQWTKSQCSLRLTKSPKQYSVFLLAPTFRPPAAWPQDSTTG